MSDFQFQDPTTHFLTIDCGTGPIVTISADGTVTINKEGSAPEAAKIFWDAVGFHIQTVISERDSLKRRVEELEAMFSEELEELEISNRRDL